ncbi:hypothetical protein HOB94_03395, partial [bacterium]|nr:hypothetical protein [bacterium]
MSNNYLIFSNLLPSLESIILYHNTNKSSLIKSAFSKSFSFLALFLFSSFSKISADISSF